MTFEVLGEAVTQHERDHSCDAAQPNHIAQHRPLGRVKPHPPKDDGDRIRATVLACCLLHRRPARTRTLLWRLVPRMVPVQHRLVGVEQREHDRRETRHEELGNDNEQVVNALSEHVSQRKRLKRDEEGDAR